MNGRERDECDLVIDESFTFFEFLIFTKYILLLLFIGYMLSLYMDLELFILTIDKKKKKREA